MQPSDDRTIQELDQQNKAIITFLSRVYKRPVEMSSTQQAQSLATVRERLLQQDSFQEHTQLPAHHLTRDNSLQAKSGNAGIDTVSAINKGWQQRTTSLIQVLATVLVIGALLGSFLALLASHHLQSRSPHPVGSSSPIASSSPSSESWKAVTTANPQLQQKFSNVAAVSTNDVWAVGETTHNINLPTRALIEHWNGIQWHVFTSPVQGSLQNGLNAVAAVSANDVWAVGYYSASADASSTQALIEHWDGIQWRMFTSPQVSASTSLYGVAVLTTDDIWAVGSTSIHGSSDGRGPIGEPLIEHWNGARWSIVKSPNVGQTSGLSSVAAASVRDIWAVGYTSNDVGFPRQTLIEHWNGFQWSIITTAYAGQLNGVAAVSANDAWAVGTLSSGNTPPHALSLHWNGSRWSPVASPNPGQDTTILYGVTAVSANNSWAVGSYFNKNEERTLVEHWDGMRWSVIRSPNPGGSDVDALMGVAQVPGSPQLWAVGFFGVGGADKGYPFQALSEVFN